LRGGGARSTFAFKRQLRGGGVATGAGAALQENSAKYTGRGGGAKSTCSLKPRLPPGERICL
jgi:hypothetical protein